MVLSARTTRMRPTSVITASHATISSFPCRPLLLRRLTRIDHIVGLSRRVVLPNETATRHSPAILVACLKAADRLFSAAVTREKRSRIGNIRTTKERLIQSLLYAGRSRLTTTQLRRAPHTRFGNKTVARVSTTVGLKRIRLSVPVAGVSPLQTRVTNRASRPRTSQFVGPQPTTVFKKVVAIVAGIPITITNVGRRRRRQGP